jgi:hypothetical protein
MSVDAEEKPEEGFGRVRGLKRVRVVRGGLEALLQWEDDEQGAHDDEWVEVGALPAVSGAQDARCSGRQGCG